jgi:ElaB/YqjD/DUF883 family membrane-anchored ribosome-binding protein
MSDNKSQGSAGSALGAHSKDSPQGQGASAAATGTMGQHGGSQSSGVSQGDAKQGGRDESSSDNWQQAGAEMAGQAKEGMERVANTVRDAASTARDTIATRGSQAMESTGQMVRDQPMTALAVTGLACFAIGMMIGRGRY